MTECTCVYVHPYGAVHFCGQHQRPASGEPSPLGKSIRRTSHSHKTGSPSARNNRRMRQLMREGLDLDHKKKRKGMGG